MRVAGRGIGSIEVGFKLIDVLMRVDEPLRLKEIASRAGMAPSKAHLYLVSFTREGVVEQDAQTLKYRLGRRALHMGVSAFRQTDFTELARSELPSLREATSCAAYISVWSNAGPVILQKVDGPYQGSMAVRLGFVLPVLSTATGRVFLSHLPAYEYAHLVESVQPQSQPDGGLSFVASVRTLGYASSAENQVNPGFFAVAAPIVGQDKGIIAALTVLGPRHLLKMHSLEHFGKIVRSSSARIGPGAD